jgi:hypothetical protein
MPVVYVVTIVTTLAVLYAWAVIKKDVYPVFPFIR